VNRDVERRKTLVEDPLELRLAQVGQRDEIPVHEREDVVVVLDEELAPHALRVLIHEAEDAVVVAALRLARLELHSERNAVLAHPFDLARGAVGRKDPQAEGLLRDLRAEVDFVMELDPVDLEDALPRQKPEALPQAARLDLRDGERVAETDHAVRRNAEPRGSRGRGNAFVVAIVRDFIR